MNISCGHIASTAGPHEGIAKEKPRQGLHRAAVNCDEGKLLAIVSVCWVRFNLEYGVVRVPSRFLLFYCTDILNLQL